MIEWAQISKPQKIPGPKINLKKKIPGWISKPHKFWRYVGTITNLRIVWISRISLLKSSQPKNTCPQKRFPAKPEIINNNFLLIIETVIYASFSTVLRLLVKVVYLPDVNYWISTSRNNLILTFINCYAPDLQSAHNIFKQFLSLITLRITVI